jgi:hypothetical protein
MKVADFINLWKTGKLGKKRQHTGYRVIDGDHCQLLVRSTSHRGVPGGSELIGIYFGNNVCIFHANFDGIRDSVIKKVECPKPVLCGAVMKGNDPALIDSGIIGFDDEKGLLLVEIGETPWLFECDPLFKPSRYTTWDWKYNTGTQLGKRVETVAEAEKDIVLDDGVVSMIGYLLKVMPSNFTPLTTSEEDQKLLMLPPNPADYGLTLDDMCVQTVYNRGGRGCTPLFVKDKVLVTQRGAQFMADALAHNAAAKRFSEVEPAYWDQLTSDENGTLLVGANEQVYIKGHVYHRYASSESGDFKVWHQVLGKTTKIRLPVR